MTVPVRPLLLVDIDGVVNCFGDLGRSLVSFEDEFTAMGRYRIQVPQGARQALRELAEAFDCVWATTWQADAQPHIGDRLGIDPPWPYIDLDAHEPDSNTEKLAAVRAYVADRPAAWIDDILGADAHAWARDRAEPTLLIQPDCVTGLTREHTDTLLAWARDLTLAR